MATQTLPAQTKAPFAPKGEFWTDEEIMSLPDDQGQRYELWDGRLTIMSPATPQHEEISFRLLLAMGNFVEERRLGFIYGGNAGFRLNPLTCYAPDVSFVSKERLRLIRYNPEKFLKDAPDLAVEVVSPNDSIRQTAKKNRRLLSAWHPFGMDDPAAPTPSAGLSFSHGFHRVGRRCST